MPAFKQTFKQLVASIEAGTCKKTHLELSNLGLKDEDLAKLIAAINSPKAAEFKAKLVSLDLGNKHPTKENKFSNISLENFPALKALNLENTDAITLTLKKMPALQVLKAKQNNLTALITDFMPNLLNMNVSDSNLTAFNPALYPNIKKLNLENNRLAILDLSDLKYLASSNIRQENLNAPEQDAERRSMLRTVYIGNGTTFDEQLEYNSQNFDPITLNILLKQKTAHPTNYFDYASPAPPIAEFGIGDIKNYLSKMLQHYKINRGGIELTNAASTYMLWLFNSEISKPNTSKHYHITPWIDGYDNHLSIINELFKGILMDRANDLYRSINRNWLSQETKEFNKFALDQINKISFESINKLMHNKTLATSMIRRAREFNKSQDLKAKHSSAIVAAPAIPAKRKTMLNSMVSKQIYSMYKAVTSTTSSSKKTTKKNRLQD